MWFVVLSVLYVLLAVSIVISLLLNGVRPSKTLAWLLAIFTIPVGGILLYLLVGRNRRKLKMYRIAKRLPGTGAASTSITGFPPDQSLIQKLISGSSGFPPTTGNRVELLKDGQKTFTRIFEALECAQKTIHVQYYIFEEGDLADRLLKLFIEKESQGVEVRLIYDGIGSYSLSRSYLAQLKAAGIEVYSFLPFRFGKFLSSLNARNHRKIIVVDGNTAFTGGINVSDKYLKGDKNLGMWHDMHVRVQGPAAVHLDTVFINDWELVTGNRLPLPPPFDGRVGGDSEAKARGVPVQVLATGPDDDFPLMEQLYFAMINSAREYVYITNPYVIPGQAIQTALQTAALAGVDVRILLSEKADSKLVNWCVRSYFNRFLQAGVRIYLYPEGFLHSKIIVSDDWLSTIGTANVDDRSFQHNYEVNAVMYDREKAIELRRDFLAESGKSIELSYETFRQRPWTHRLAEGAARTFSPLL